MGPAPHYPSSLGVDEKTGSGSYLPVSSCYSCHCHHHQHEEDLTQESLTIPSTFSKTSIISGTIMDHYRIAPEKECKHSNPFSTAASRNDDDYGACVPHLHPEIITPLRHNQKSLCNLPAHHVLQKRQQATEIEKGGVCRSTSKTALKNALENSQSFKQHESDDDVMFGDEHRQSYSKQLTSLPCEKACVHCNVTDLALDSCRNLMASEARIFSSSCNISDSLSKAEGSWSEVAHLGGKENNLVRSGSRNFSNETQRQFSSGGKVGRKGVFGDRCKWLLLGSLLFLSLCSSANSLSILDDDEDDDEFGGVSSFTQSVYRQRRSAESFSTLNDALSLIPSNYSIHEPPPTNNSEATQVDFSVLIMNVRDIKELNEGYGDLELSLEMNLRIWWKDTRLSHLADRSGKKFIVLNPVLLDKIWHPDIFIDHVKGVAQPSLISKPASLRVYPDSSVRYSARITVTMACQMDFHYYPADTQRCNVDMKSYAYSSKILALDWREGKGALLVEYLELPNFDVALDTTQNFMVNTGSGSYSGIRFTILLRRKLSYHLIQTYLPSTLFIIVSWLSFLVPPESVPGRMALCMTTLLTLTAMFSAVRQNTPNVSYVKALDIWMVVCIIFVFLTLVEYTVLLKLKSKKPKPKPLSAQTELAPASQPQQPATRWTIPALQYSSDVSNFKFRGCKNVDAVINENGSTGEMRHRENGDSVGAPGDNGNNVTSPPAPPTSPTPPPLPPPPPAPMHPSDKPLNKYELAAKKIEKFTSAVIPTLFVIFNFIYWPWLIESADYYHQEKSTTIFKSM